MEMKKKSLLVTEETHTAPTDAHTIGSFYVFNLIGIPPFDYILIHWFVIIKMKSALSGSTIIIIRL